MDLGIYLYGNYMVKVKGYVVYYENGDDGVSLLSLVIGLIFWFKSNLNSNALHGRLQGNG